MATAFGRGFWPGVDGCLSKQTTYSQKYSKKSAIQRAFVALTAASRLPQHPRELSLRPSFRARFRSAWGGGRLVFDAPVLTSVDLSGLEATHVGTERPSPCHRTTAAIQPPVEGAGPGCLRYLDPRGLLERSRGGKGTEAKRG